MSLTSLSTNNKTSRILKTVELFKYLKRYLKKWRFKYGFKMRI